MCETNSGGIARPSVRCAASQSGIRRARLAGKIAIVTGAGSRGPGVGNGKATAILMAREGARVLCVDAQKDRAEETVALIHAERGEALAFAADVTLPRPIATRWWPRPTAAGAASTSSTTTWASSRDSC